MKPLLILSYRAALVKTFHGSLRREHFGPNTMFHMDSPRKYVIEMPASEVADDAIQRINEDTGFGAERMDRMRAKFIDAVESLRSAILEAESDDRVIWHEDYFLEEIRSMAPLQKINQILTRFGLNPIRLGNNLEAMTEEERLKEGAMIWALVVSRYLEGHIKRSNLNIPVDIIATSSWPLGVPKTD